MKSIDGIGYPLVYKTAVSAPAPDKLPTGGIAIRTQARALGGMQKEALVYYGPTGTVWRMVSDEGPYLNGTDLAPFPLAFYTAGMALSFIEQLNNHAANAGIKIKDYKLTQDNHYTMEGSALRGDMVGGANPVEWQIELQIDAPEQTISTLIELAARTSPAQVYMNEQLNNTFALCVNGAQIPVTNVNPSPKKVMFEKPAQQIEALSPLNEETYAEDIIIKQKSADTVFGVEGGAGSSMQSEQKRSLHVRGVITPREDGMKEINVQLFKPLGSSFRFLGDSSKAEGGQERAPSGLAYLAAGVGFCFMTQIGRYATILKHDLKSYSIVQDTIFDIGIDNATAKAVDTHTFLETSESIEASQKTLSMSERTCFLHAAMRSSNKTKITSVEII